MNLRSFFFAACGRRELPAIIGALVFSVIPCSLPAADYPAPIQADYVIHDFRFNSGEVLPELKMHYRALGSPQRDAKGIVTNAVLILHGTTGNGGNFTRPDFA